MSQDSYQDDLPVLHPDHELPVSLQTSRRRHIAASRQLYPAWATFASQRHVRTIALDQAGNIWLATVGGVLRWLTNRQFTRYGSEHGLPGNSVAAVAVDGQGRVWAAHEQYGLYYFTSDRWHPYEMIEKLIEQEIEQQIAKPLPSANLNLPPFTSQRAISCLTIDDKGHLWVAKPQGLYALSCTPDKPEPLRALPLPAGTPPRALAIMQDQIWLCQARGVFRYHDKQWQRHLDWPDVLHLALGEQHLWLATLRGLKRLSLASQEIVSLTHAKEITALAVSGQDVWFASGRKIAHLTPTGVPKPLPFRHSRPLRVTALAPDSQRQLWVGSEQGLFGGSPVALQPLLTEEAPDVIGLDAMSNMILSLTVYQDATQAQLWIGTSRDLVCLDLRTQNWRKYRELTGVQHLVVNHPDDDVWAASSLEGLYHLEPRSGKIEQVQAPRVEAFGASATGTLWLVTEEGLYLRCDTKWTLVLPTDKLPVGYVRVLAQANDNQRLWLGTSQGLFAYDPNTKAQQAVKLACPHLSVQALLAIPHVESNELWVGTEQRLVVGKANDLPTSEPLARCEVNALAWDAANKLIWVGSETGLLCFTQSGSKRHEFTVHNSGLSANRITALALSSPDSGQTNLWIGTPSGLSCYTY